MISEIKRDLKFLLVDDDFNFAKTLCAILGTAGHECLPVNDAAEAMRVLEHDHYDCVLSDVRMSGLSGADLYQWVKTHQPGLPFILMTAYTSSEVIEEALAAGVLAVLQKPVDIQSILQFCNALQQDRQMAVICEEAPICTSLADILDQFANQYSFSLFRSLTDFTQGHTAQFGVVLFNAHQMDERACKEITDVLLSLTRRAIIVLCDYQHAFMHSEIFKTENLVILPRRPESVPQIEALLQKQIRSLAKNYLTNEVSHV